MINVIGIGYGENDLTLLGLQCMRESDVVVAKSALLRPMKAVRDAGIVFQTLDDLYERAEDFDSLNTLICERLTALSQSGSVAYLVQGSGQHDTGVQQLMQSTEVRIIPGVDISSHALAVAGVYSSSIVTMSAYEFTARRALVPDGKFTVVITDIDDAYIAGEVKLSVQHLVGDLASVTLVNAGTATQLPLADIDRQSAYDYSTCLVIPPLSFLERDRYSYSDLLEIIYRLRQPDGCKWDRAQTHDSIKANAVEEAYELLEAVNLRDVEKMTEESGDVLLQGLFQAVIGEDASEYDHVDMMTVLCTKLIFRHTHIFGNVVANTPEEALQAWEQAKSKEKHYDSFSDRMDGVALTLTPTMRALKLQKIAKKGNMDWTDTLGVYAKVAEELDELRSADSAHIEDECGDLLFAVVNLLRHLGVDPDNALIAATSKFVRRFKYVEAHVLAEGRAMADCSMEYLDELWQAAKANENR